MLFNASFYSNIASLLDSFNLELVICIVIHYTQFLPRRAFRDHLVTPVSRSFFFFLVLFMNKGIVKLIIKKRLKDSFFSIILCTNHILITNESYLTLETDLMIESALYTTVI